MLLSSSTPVRLEKSTSLSSCFTVDYSGLHAHGEWENPIYLWTAKATKILGSLSFRGRRMASECGGKKFPQDTSGIPLSSLSEGANRSEDSDLLLSPLHQCIVGWRKEKICCVDESSTIEAPFQKLSSTETVKFVPLLKLLSTQTVKQIVKKKHYVQNDLRNEGLNKYFIFRTWTIWLCVPACSLKLFIIHNTWH